MDQTQPTDQPEPHPQADGFWNCSEGVHHSAIPSPVDSLLQSINELPNLGALQADALGQAFSQFGGPAWVPPQTPSPTDTATPPASPTLPVGPYQVPLPPSEDETEQYPEQNFQQAGGEYGMYGGGEESEQDLFDGHVNTGFDPDKFPDVEVQMWGEQIPTMATSFEDMGLPEFLLANIKRIQWKNPTPVQRSTIPSISAFRNTLAESQTGSGKTGAFLLPIITHSHRRRYGSKRDGAHSASTSSSHMAEVLTPTDQSSASPPCSVAESMGSSSLDHSSSCPSSLGPQSCPSPTALVMAPTRELVAQLFREALRLSYSSELRVQNALGGYELKEQTYQLLRGVDLLLGTPGRVLDLLSREIVSLSGTEYFVLDEADRMLDRGMQEGVISILSHRSRLPLEERCTVMFSATLTQPIIDLAQEVLEDEILFQIGKVGPSGTVRQSIEYAYDSQKPDALLTLVKEQHPDNRIIVFCSTRQRVVDVGVSMRNAFSYKDVSVFHGGLTTDARESAVGDFSTKRSRILVATDVAGRGLDLPEVHLVVNYDLPDDMDGYIHRLGRTGRMGQQGRAVSFYNDKKNSHMKTQLWSVINESGGECPGWLSGDQPPPPPPRSAHQPPTHSRMNYQDQRPRGRGRDRPRDYNDSRRTEHGHYQGSGWKRKGKGYRDEPAYDTWEHRTPTPPRHRPHHTYNDRAQHPLPRHRDRSGRSETSEMTRLQGRPVLNDLWNVKRWLE